MAAVPISALPTDERSMDKCYDLAESSDEDFVRRRRKK